MSVECPSHNTARDLSSIIALLIDVQEALEENDFTEEALLVSNHLQELSSPHIESRIEKNGIEPVLEEMAASFSS
ncbi:MAG: hypothetical protein JW863_18215 [Chitinispirillaceae bacterium]|nr:hypothetical protein [Chitinispirillaceae bacterium]